jgi:hypothetical protein
MRRNAVLTSAALFATLALATMPAAMAGEVQKTLRLELSADPSAAFAVENLAGTMRVVPGSGRTVVAVATVHAESDEVAALMKFEQVTDDAGRPCMRVRYPIDRHDTIRYPGPDKSGNSSWMHWLGENNNRLDYDGRRVRVNSTSGTLLYADLEVQVPARQGEAVFKNHIGRLEGKDLEGTLRFDTGSGDIELQRVRGTLRADTGSGDLKVMDAGGTLSCDTGSGDCLIERFSGDKIDCDVGSGDIVVKSGSAGRIDLNTGSGDVSLRDIEAEEVSTDTGSGDVLIECASNRLRKLSTDTGSGDVTLRLGPDASFEAHAEQGSGDLVNRYADAQPIAHGRTVVGYRRGDGRTRISVETGSGDLVIEPGGAKASR